MPPLPERSFSRIVSVCVPVYMYEEADISIRIGIKQPIAV